uniref:Uncharacterized protein n=1 Tax=Avena sativa TaxID=4498 RepID=A0ACD5U4G1_AVESA
MGLTTRTRRISRLGQPSQPLKTDKQQQHKAFHNYTPQIESFAYLESLEATMKNTKLVAVLLLQALLVMGVLAHVNAEFFPKCCNNCRSFSGIDVCDDAHTTCPKGCSACRTVTTTPKKTFRCADTVSTVDGTCGGRCKKN